MPFVFVILGLLFLITAIRGTQNDMFALVKSEFWGTNSFVPWAVAIFILGAIGYAKPVRPIADAMIGLVIVVMVLANKGGFFAKFNEAIRNPTAPTATTTTAASDQPFTDSLAPRGSSLANGVPLTGNNAIDFPITGLSGLQ